MAGKRLFLALLVALVSTAAISIPARGVPTPLTTKTHQYYVLSGHPDDPVPHWAWLEQRPATDYLVFLAVTRSEGTLACKAPDEALPPSSTTESRVENVGPPADGADVPPLVAESEPNQFVAELYPVTGRQWVVPYDEFDSTGPYRYEGPNSPVDEPDRGERHPYGFPWKGQGSEACARAQVASWHWFLDEAHSIDGVGTTMHMDDPWTDDAYQGQYCFRTSATVRGQHPPRRQTRICANVWANTESARIAFDLPDVVSSVTEESGQTYSELTFGDDAVAEVLDFARQNRGRWNLPVLPEAGILAVGGYGDGEHCDGGASTVHVPVLDLVRWTDLGIGEQAGALACADDPYGQGDDVEQVTLSGNLATVVAWNVVDPATGTRRGPIVKNFGWLRPNYDFDGCVECSFWRRTS